MTPTLRPTLKQHEAWTKLLDNTTSEILFGGGAGGGKSWLFCEWLLTNCYKYPGTKWFIAREELKRIITSTYFTWTKVCKYHGIPTTDWKLNGQYNYIEFIAGAAKGSRIDLLEVKKLPTDPLYERFGSLEYTGGFFEEAGEIDFLAFDVLKSRCGRQLNSEFKLLPKVGVSANPTKNWIHSRYYVPWKNRTLPSDRAFIQSLYLDNPHTKEIYGKQLAGISNETIRRRLMLGDWDVDSDGKVFRRFKENSTARPEEAIPTHEYIIGVDLARHVDWTVLTVFDIQTNQEVFKDRFNQIDWNLQKSRIEALARRYNNAAVRVDATGLGDPIVNDLEHQGLSVIPFVFTEQSKKALIDNLALMLEQDRIKILPDEQAIHELESFMYEVRDSGKIRYGAPDGQHDDIVISLALAVYQLPEKQKFQPMRDILAPPIDSFLYEGAEPVYL